jgi:hypothetical protein
MRTAGVAFAAVGTLPTSSAVRTLSTDVRPLIIWKSCLPRTEEAL